MEQPALTHEDYTIAWISALEVELTAARCMLDEEHPDLDQAPGDTNVYTLGHVGSHNVVIACLPAGTIGLTGATTVSSNLLRTFSNIRFGLMVGVGGGAPGVRDLEDPENDIRLGDIVVSQPGKGSSGVIQFDLGIKTDDEFIQTGHLNNPPSAVMNAVQKLKSNISMEDDDVIVHKHWENMLKKSSKLKRRYEWPGDEADDLYPSDYPHPAGASTCSGCDRNLAIKRTKRWESNCSMIHYGLIGSSNELVRSAKRRDELRVQHGIICFEMEASGLMNDFPCIVIRGVTDYCDGHKNKIWQPYAAAMAAAYSRALLDVVQAVAVKKEKPAKELMKEVKAISETSLATLKIIEDIDSERRYEKLPFASGATYDAAEDQFATDEYCLKGTRVALLQQVRDWALSKTSKTIFWLNGAAGTGKVGSRVPFETETNILWSTISRTLAAEFDASKRLGASFFFKRGERDRTDIHRFFSTLAAQLSRSIPAIRPLIERAIQSDPHIGQKGPRLQFDELILRLLTSPSIGPSQLVFLVIDALDECDLDSHMQMVVDLLAKVQARSKHDIRIFMTSRPELPLRLGFKNLTSNQYTSVVLQEIQLSIILEDFTLYLKHHLSSITGEYGLPQTWPGDKDITSLVQMAVPLFIFAATIFRFISDPMWSPKAQLEFILRYKTTRMDSMDRTYEPILARLLQGPVIILGEPLSRRALSNLLGIDEETIFNRLRAFHAALHVSSDPTAPIRPHHLSFVDFLLDQSRQGSDKFSIDGRSTHQHVSERCMTLLLSTKQLKKDICGIFDGDRTLHDVSAEYVSQFMPPELQYACRYWVYHLSKSNMTDDNVQDDVLKFLETRLLFWVEALSLLGRFSESIVMLQALMDMKLAANSGSGLSRRLIVVVEDAFHFLKFSRSAIEADYRELYTSALVFAPTDSIVRRNYANQLPNWIVRFPVVQRHWDELLHVLDNKGDSEFRCLGSSNNHLLCAGNFLGDITIWNTITGEIEHTIEAHDDTITSTLFSHDDYYLISGSWDKTIKFWNVASGELRLTMEADDVVTAIAISPEGIVLSSAPCGSILVWEVESSSISRRLPGHSSSSNSGIVRDDMDQSEYFINAMAFSPNGKLISASNDKTVRVWQQQSYTALFVLSGHTARVSCVAVAADDTTIASGSDDCTIKLWNIQTGKLQQTIDSGYANNGKSTFIDVLTYSRNGLFLICAYDDGIHLFETLSYAYMRSIHDSNFDLHALVLSSSGMLVSGGSRAAKLWLLDFDCTAGTSDIEVRAPRTRIERMELDPTGRFLALADANGFLRLHEVSTNKITIIDSEPQRKKYPFRFLIWSSNSKLLAGSYHDKTELYTTDGHRQLLQIDSNQSQLGLEACFSPDCKKLAAISMSHSAGVFDLKTSTSYWRNDIADHPTAICFSEDGHLIAIANERQYEVWNSTLHERKWSLDHGSEYLYDLTLSPDNNFVALVFGDPKNFNNRIISIYETSTGKVQESLEHSGGANGLKFNPTFSYFDTIHGPIPFKTAMNHIAKSPMDEIKKLKFQGNWIYRNNRKLLWLPDRYRGLTIVYGNLLVIGVQSGEVIMMEFLDEGAQQSSEDMQYKLEQSLAETGATKEISGGS